MQSDERSSIQPGTRTVRIPRPRAPSVPPSPSEPDPAPDEVPIWRRIERANRLLREADRTMDAVASRAGWPVPFSSVRFLVLAHLRTATSFGHSPARLARTLAMKRSSLAHHLDVLEEAALITRSPKGIHDRRKVAVRLTERGLYALWRLGSALRTPGRPGSGGRHGG